MPIALHCYTPEQLRAAAEHQDAITVRMLEIIADVSEAYNVPVDDIRYRRDKHRKTTAARHECMRRMCLITHQAHVARFFDVTHNVVWRAIVDYRDRRRRQAKEAIIAPSTTEYARQVELAMRKARSMPKLPLKAY